MSILRQRFINRLATFSPDSDVVFDESGVSVPQIREKMLSGYTPQVRVRQYTSEKYPNASIGDIMQGISKPPSDITDIVNAENREILHQIEVKQQESITDPNKID